MPDRRRGSIRAGQLYLFGYKVEIHPSLPGATNAFSPALSSTTSDTVR